MVAYSFKSGFAPMILARTKRQTIRNPRKRHARAGEALQLYTGMRTRSCRLLGVATAVAVREVRLDFVAGLVELDDAVRIEGDAALDAFALSDGFEPRATGVTPWMFMRRWWRETHGADVFRGVLIEWGDSLRPADVLGAADQTNGVRQGGTP